MLIIPERDMISESTQHTCDYHKRHPGHRDYAGCTCGGSWTFRKKTPEEIESSKKDDDVINARFTKGMKPIIFSGPMVRAILDGRKTQTRRVMQIQPSIEPLLFDGPKAAELAGSSYKGQTLAVWSGESEFDYYDCHCPYGAPGEKMWVRENIEYVLENDNYYYQADRHGVGNEIYQKLKTRGYFRDVRPCIHMPLEACRLFPTIKDIRVERLQDITEEDVVSEGVEVPRCPRCRYSQYDCRFHLDHGMCGEPEPDSGIPAFQDLWDSINAKKHPWSDNPWVWVVSFSKEETR